MKKYVFISFLVFIFGFSSVFALKISLPVQKKVNEKIARKLNEKRVEIFSCIDDSIVKKKISTWFDLIENKTHVSQSGVYFNWNGVFKKLNSEKTFLLEVAIDVVFAIDQMNIPVALLLARNGLKMLPQNFKQLKNVKYLNLESNKICEFPSEICEISALEELILVNNEIDEVPYKITQLINLKVLDLSYNKLEEFPIWILLLNQLERFELANNLVSALPAGLYHQVNIDTGKNLKILNLNKNQIKIFDFNKTLFPYIEEIWLLGNPIEDPSSLTGYGMNKNGEEIKVYFVFKKSVV